MPHISGLPRGSPKSVQTLTSEYTATDGGNFKIDMQSTYISSNLAHVTYYINGVQKYTLLSSIDSHKGTAEINNIPVGAKVKFFITVDKSDTFTFKFFLYVCYRCIF